MRIPLSRTRFVALLGVAACCIFSVRCARPAIQLPPTPSSAIALTGGTNTSMVYLARVPGGVIAIDLGWWGADSAVVRALRELGATPDSVIDVFLTHSHRDHVGAWRLLRHSRFHLEQRELPAFIGAAAHHGWIPRAAEWIKRTPHPRSGDVVVQTFAHDTVFAFGTDTLQAFSVTGHTAGSAAYLFRGVLFVGDAITHSRRGGFAPARRGYSDDSSLAARSLRELWSRLPEGGVRYVCTAHARCSRFTSQFLADVMR